MDFPLVGIDFLYEASFEFSSRDPALNQGTSLRRLLCFGSICREIISDLRMRCNKKPTGMNRRAQVSNRVVTWSSEYRYASFYPDRIADQFGIGVHQLVAFLLPSAYLFRTVFPYLFAYLHSTASHRHPLRASARCRESVAWCRLSSVAGPRKPHVGFWQSKQPVLSFLQRSRASFRRPQW